MSFINWGVEVLLFLSYPVRTDLLAYAYLKLFCRSGFFSMHTRRSMKLCRISQIQYLERKCNHDLDCLCLPQLVQRAVKSKRSRASGCRLTHLRQVMLTFSGYLQRPRDATEFCISYTYVRWIRTHIARFGDMCPQWKRDSIIVDQYSPHFRTEI